MAVSAHGRLVFDGNILRREVVVQAPSEPTRFLPAGLGLIGALTVLVAAWGGLAPFVGPTFGYRANASGPWYWNMAHFLLAFAPGVVGLLAGLMVIGGAAVANNGRGRMVTTLAGLMALAAGAWFVIGPLAWPFVQSGSYFSHRPPLAALTNQVGYSMGPGLLLVLFGGFALGWAARHQRQVITTLPLGTGMESTVQEISVPAGSVLSASVPAGSALSADAVTETVPTSAPADSMSAIPVDSSS